MPTRAYLIDCGLEEVVSTLAYLGFLYLMNPVRGMISLAKASERGIARFYLKRFQERAGLLTILLHSLFADETEIEKDLVDPLERITIAHLRKIIEYFKSCDYHFVSPHDLMNDYYSNKRQIMLTFDDGYYNNIRALPLLEEFQVPAVFFISTSHIRESKAFWWDALYRRRTEHSSHGEMPELEISEYKKLRTEDIERKLRKQYGDSVLLPVSNVDRPFTPGELAEFSRHELVHIGNHTVNHAILTNYSREEVHYQIRQAQDDLKDITGKRPDIISYPNGNHSSLVIRVASQLGLKLGVTVHPRKNSIPVHPRTKRSMRLGRFVLYGDDDLLERCELYRSDFLFYQRIRRLLNRQGAYS